jgi:hypothetical protein
VTEPLTDAELAQILADTKRVAASHFIPLPLAGLLHVAIPRLVAELRAQRSELLALRADYEETLNIATAGVLELRDAVAARDAQIARYRQVVEGAEVAT